MSDKISRQLHFIAILQGLGISDHILKKPGLAMAMGLGAGGWKSYGRGEKMVFDSMYVSYLGMYVHDKIHYPPFWRPYRTPRSRRHAELLV
jgi:hypothetical protein